MIASSLVILIGEWLRRPLIRLGPVRHRAAFVFANPVPLLPGSNRGRHRRPPTLARPLHERSAMDGFQSQPFCQTAKEFQMARGITPVASMRLSRSGPKGGYAGEYERRGEYGNGKSRRPRIRGSSEESGRVGEFVSRNPYSTVMTSFGIGFGFGLFVTLLYPPRSDLVRTVCTGGDPGSARSPQAPARSAQASARSVQTRPRIGGLLRAQFLEALVSRDNRKTVTVSLSERPGPTSPGLFCLAYDTSRKSFTSPKR